MSIHSQKSLNDDCSDILERSYSHSGKTGIASDDSSSGDDEDESLAKELMNKMTPAVLSKLRRCFKKCKKSVARDLDSKVEEVMRVAAAEEGIEFAITSAPSDPLSLDESAFVTAINQIFGHHKFSTHAQKLFRVLDPYNAGRAKWKQLVSKLEAVGAKKTGSKRDRWNRVIVANIQRLEHCKRETIVKLLNIEREECFCYIAVSKGGRVGVYNGYMKILHTYEVFYHRTGLHRRVKNCWITDAIYLTDVQNLILSASDRSLTVYDATTLCHTPLFCITGLPNIPTNLILSSSDSSLTVYDATTLCHTLFCITGLPNIPNCLAYAPSSNGRTSELAIGSERGDIVRLTFLQPRAQLFHSKAPDTINYYFWMCLAYAPSSCGGTSELAIGSERGDILRLIFLQPRAQLFHSKAPDNINYYFWMELSSPPHTSNHVITIWRRVHARSICRLAYVKDGDILLSCSHDSSVSVRARHVPGKLNDYVFKVQRGVSCFHAVYPLHLLATGSVDGCVRLWETTQSTPFAVLPVPTQPAVLDVAVVPAREVVVAFCNNCTVHIWDIYEECLLQTLKLKFPFLGILGHKVEFGTYCIHPGPIYKTLEEEQLEPVPSTSRRTSSVFQAPSGGLILQELPELDTSVKNQPLYARFNRSSLLITCCSHVCVVQLAPPRGVPPPPPADSLPPRRPSVWDLPLLADLRLPASPSPMPTPTQPSKFLAPSSATEYTVNDLDTLLANAGLQGILEKDFVLMEGLKHDLNKKLAEMEAGKDAMRAAVNMGAPYLSLKIYPPVTIDPVDEMTDEYKRVMKLFPGSSVAGTPSNSEHSTPRNSRNSKL